MTLFAYAPLEASIATLIENTLPRLATFRACERSERTAARAWATMSCMDSDPAAEIVLSLRDYERIVLYEAGDYWFAIAYQGDSKVVLTDNVDESVTGAEIAYLKDLARKKLRPWWRSKEYGGDVALIVICVIAALCAPFLIGGGVQVTEWSFAVREAALGASVAFLCLGLWSAWMSNRSWKRTARALRGALQLRSA